MINILMFGDISGNVGLEMLKEWIPKLKKKYKVDFIIANGENSAKHFGITQKEYMFMKECGVDVITSGNHAFDKISVEKIIDKEDFLIPANWNPYLPGKGTTTIKKNNIEIRITNLLCRVFMPCYVENPYFVLDKIVADNPDVIHIVDLHGESAGEKCCIAFNYDGMVSAVIGTHTHVQTADNRVLPKGTAFITDVGFTGPYNSAIGVDFNEAIFKTKVGMNARLIPSENPGQVSAVLLTINEITKKAKEIKRIFITPESEYCE